MAQKFTVPITVKQLSSASSDAVTVFVDQDTYARLKLEAGGRLVWGSGSGAGDVNLYRDGADVLRTDDTFKTPTLFVDSIEIDPTGATTDQVLKFDGTKFVAASSPAGVSTLDGLTDVISPSPSDGQFLKYVSASSAWIPAAIPTINALDDIGDVVLTSASATQVLTYNGSNWVNQAPSIGSGNLDGGLANSFYGLLTITGGSA